MSNSVGIQPIYNLSRDIYDPNDRVYVPKRSSSMRECHSEPHRLERRTSSLRDVITKIFLVII